jgi:FkbM family methyltransferase
MTSSGDDAAPSTGESRDLSHISLDFSTPRGQHCLLYALDRRSPVQRGMHDELDGGAFYERETTVLVASVLRPGDVFVDVGAHVGYFSVLASAMVGPTGQVVSFEPEPGNYAQLINHIRLNKLANVLPIHCAAGAEETVLDLHINSDNDGGHALWDVRRHVLNEKSRAAPRAHPVFVATLDRVLANVAVGRVRAIKIDVEGNEHSVLRGARETLEKHQVPFVVAEINRDGLGALGSSEDALREYMASLGYETWLVHGGELKKLEPGQTVEGNFVFNVLFRRPGVGLSA